MLRPPKFRTRVSLGIVCAAFTAGTVVGGLVLTHTISINLASSSSSPKPSISAGHARKGFRGFGIGGSVTSVSSNSFVIKTQKAAPQTVDTTSSTKYSEPGTSIKPTGVAVGDQVLVMPTRSASGSGATPAPGATPTAALVQIILPRVSGTVTAISGDDITVAGRQGKSSTVVVSSSTTYHVLAVPKSGTSAATGSLSGIVKGDIVNAIGDKDSSGKLDALSVTYGKAPAVSSFMGRGAFGVVQSVSGDDITITEFGNKTETVVVSSSTTYKSRSASASLSSVAKGDMIIATGTLQSNGTFAATQVFVGALGGGAMGGHPFFGGGRGGHFQPGAASSGSSQSSSWNA